MKEYKLDYATFYNHENGIVEAIVNPDIEISGQNLLDMFSLFESMQPAVEYMISNRKNKYSFSFEAMTKFNQNKTIKAVAVVCYNRTSGFSIEKLWPKFTKLAFFDSMDDAYTWINSLQLEKTLEIK